MSTYHKILFFFRKVYLHCFPKSESLNNQERGITDVSDASNIITKFLNSNKPCLIARLGSNELDAICNYMSINNIDKESHTPINYVTGNCAEWWWSKNYFKRMFAQAGFYPCTPENISKFSDMMLNDCKEIDILGSWRKRENMLLPYFKANIIRIDREKINPFFAENPWTLALEGKKVLVIHPFENSIREQYKKIDKIFKRPILPNFDLHIIKAVQSLGGSNKFQSWFEALDFMKSEMDNIDYDIVLLGCGAYGLPLAAHAKRMGKKAIHIGGALQLFFGIKGKRWESTGYKNSPNDYSSLFNENWIRPSLQETPQNASNVEEGCYW